MSTVIRDQMKWGVRNGPLAALVILAVMLRFMEGLAAGMRRNPEPVLGGNPIGASPVVKSYAKTSGGLFKKARVGLGRIVQKYYPAAWPRIQKLFT